MHRNGFAPIAGYLVMVLFMSGCAEPPKEPPLPSAVEGIALTTRVLHCELARISQTPLA